MEEHVQLVRGVPEKLLAAKLYIKVSKCEFHHTELDYLGHRISSKGIAMDPAKVETVLGWKAPEARKQLQSFLGFANFYRQFISGFTEIALPLTDLLHTQGSTARVRPGQHIAWTPECQQAFDILKTRFASSPILQHPNQQTPFVVQVDASDVAVGAVLLEPNEQGHLSLLVPRCVGTCAYMSKKFNPTESDGRFGRRKHLLCNGCYLPGSTY